MDLTSDDKHNMQSNPKHVPNPVVSDRRSVTFHLPLGLQIVYESDVLQLFVYQLKLLFVSFHRPLENERLLLVLADRDKHAIYLERLTEMDAAVQRAKAIKTLNRKKAGEDVLFSYDEGKRMLAVCASAKVGPDVFSRWKP